MTKEKLYESIERTTNDLHRDGVEVIKFVANQPKNGNNTESYSLLLKRGDNLVSAGIDYVTRDSGEEQMVLFSLVGRYNKAHLTEPVLLRLRTWWKKNHKQVPFQINLSEDGDLIIGVCGSAEKCKDNTIAMVLNKFSETVPQIQHLTKQFIGE